MKAGEPLVAPVGARSTNRRLSFGSLARRLKLWLLFGPAIAFLIVFFVTPTALLLSSSFHDTDAYGYALPGLSLGEYRTIATTPYLANSIFATAVMALEVMALCLLLGYPVAYSLVHVRSRTLRAILYSIVVSPLLTSVVVRTYGWVVMLAANGPINELLLLTRLTPTPLKLLYTYPATVISVAHVLLPFAILPLAAAISELNPDLSKAAAVLGANRVQTFWHVTLPLSAQGILAAALLAFTVAMGTYITPVVVGGATQPLASIRVYVVALTLYNIPLSAALSVALLLITACVAAAVLWIFRIWERRTYGQAD